MEIVIKVDDALLEPHVREAVSRCIVENVKRTVLIQMSYYSDKIDHAVELYLAKRLTDKRVFNEIDAAVKRIIDERLDEKGGY
jgi:hypothetical protein